MELNTVKDPSRNTLSFYGTYSEAHLEQMGHAVHQMLVDSIAGELFPDVLEYVRNHIDWKKITDAAQAALIANVTKEFTHGSSIQSPNDTAYHHERRTGYARR